MNRRNLMKMIPPGLLLPGQILSDFSWEHGFFNESLRSSFQQQKIAELFKKAIIIDGLVISRDWNEESFDALTKSGYTGFGTSLASGSLKSALKS
jgi:membrane dipeptidase